MDQLVDWPVMDGGMYVDMLGHFTHGKAHVSIEFVPYLYRKAMMFYTDTRSTDLFVFFNRSGFDDNA